MLLAEDSLLPEVIVFKSCGELFLLVQYIIFIFGQLDEVRSFLEHSYAILSSIKIMIIFNNTSADFVLISADVLLNRL